jgi:tRNA pseudouridine38-40 synthase
LNFEGLTPMSPNPQPPLRMRRNLRFTVAYDGTNYCGWQVQANGPSLQAAIEKGILKLTGEKCAVYSAGRTDSGVHALGQVINFHTSSRIPVKNWPAALQTKLPFDILLLDAREVPAKFHATFAAKRKSYRYVIHNGPAVLPFLRNYVYHFRRPLDVAAMETAARHLLGTHDFRSFETDWPNKETSVRTVFDISFTRRPHWDVWSNIASGALEPPPEAAAHLSLRAPFLCIDITADGFLYNMVRTIVGTLINVGTGKWSPDDVLRILTAQNRSLAGSTAPAQGLYLVSVDYGETDIPADASHPRSSA